MGQVACDLLVSPLAWRRENGTGVVAEEGPALVATGLKNPTLGPPEDLGERTPRCLVTPLLEGLVGPALGMTLGLDKQPELVGVTGIARGHSWLFVLGCKAGTGS